MTAVSKQQRESSPIRLTGDSEGKGPRTAPLHHGQSSSGSSQGPERAGGSLWRRLVRFLYGSFIEPLVASRNTPTHDARGVSLGLFIGFIVPVGGQLLMLTLLRMAIRFNYVAAVGFSLVSNPFDMIPMYYGYYCLGSYILGKPASLDFSVFRCLMNPVMNKAYFWEAFSAFTALGGEILERWLVSALVLSFVFGPLGYLVTYEIQKRRGRKAAERLGMEYGAFLEHLERKARNKNAADPGGAATEASTGGKGPTQGT
jgi:uncharacterized protein